MERKMAGALKQYYPLSIEHFQLGPTIGTGSFGRVRMVTHMVSDTVWALKILRKTDVFRLRQVDHVLNERNCLERLHHPFIVDLAGTFQDEKCLYMALEFVTGGEFYSYLRSEKRLDSPTAKFYATQVVLFLEYIHSQDVCYRDLKPENILFDRHGYIKMVDFGFSKKISFKSYTLCGTPEYMAPEIILSSGHGKGVDWWALGVLCYELQVGQPPWIDGDGTKGPMGIYQQILSSKPVKYPKFIEPEAKAIMKLLLEPDLTRRYGCLKDGAGDVKRHPWFNELNWGAIYDKELTAPYLPKLGGDVLEGSYADCSNFDPFPESMDKIPVPKNAPLKDPFTEF
jgi:serine/threonine protein kinase